MYKKVAIDIFLEFLSSTIFGNCEVTKSSLRVEYSSMLYSYNTLRKHTQTHLYFFWAHLELVYEFIQRMSVRLPLFKDKCYYSNINS